MRNGARWTRELLDALATTDTAIIKRRRRKINHPDVRQALGQMYHNLCCYCESQVAAVRADEIEHRMPITRFPQAAFDWSNLHLACSGCNGAKSDKWDVEYPVLDATRDTVHCHLDYDLLTTGVWQNWTTGRGKTTVEHADMNRIPLCRARGEVMLSALSSIKEIRERRKANPADVAAENAMAQLAAMYDGAYGSVIRWTVSTFL